MIKIALILLGSALGGLMRWGLMSVSSFSLLGNLLLINVGGSFVFGILYPLVMQSEWRLFIFVGFLGSFTTLSTLSFEVFSLLQNARIALAIFYAFGSLGLSIFSLGIGIFLGKNLSAL